MYVYVHISLPTQSIRRNNARLALAARTPQIPPSRPARDLTVGGPACPGRQSQCKSGSRNVLVDEPGALQPIGPLYLKQLDPFSCAGDISLRYLHIYLHKYGRSRYFQFPGTSRNYPEVGLCSKVGSVTQLCRWLLLVSLLLSHAPRYLGMYPSRHAPPDNFTYL